LNPPDSPPVPTAREAEHRPRGVGISSLGAGNPSSEAGISSLRAENPPPEAKRRPREEGLTSGEAERRLTEVGPNELEEKKRSPVLQFFSFFWGPIPWMIEVAMVLSALIGRWEDFFIIGALLALNAGVGFLQEQKADRAVAALKKKLALSARVLRDGRWQEVAARDLVPGDLVRIRPGEIVPADLELVSDGILQIDESALTGESLPVERARGDQAYSGSIVRRGEMNGTVTATGMNTFFGATTRLVEEAETKSHFQRAVVKIGDYLIVLAVGLVVLIFLVALYRHESIPETLQFALVLTVAAIPAALPAVLSVTMVVGAGALARKKAIVSRLVAIEEMAGVDVLCSDKTGTITRNELSVAQVVPWGQADAEEVLLYGSLASLEENHDPIDDAVLAEARKVAEVEARRKAYSAVDFEPFDPVSKRTEALLQDSKGAEIRAIKGAPQVIMDAASLSQESRAALNGEVNALADRGYRALGVARSAAGGGFDFLGLLALFDPPRDDSAETIRHAKELGVEVKMITGDHGAIARQVAGQVHMGDRIEEVSSFLDKPDREAERIVEEADGFAQVYPEHKYHIVELLQKRGHIVGMTGDGVNDAPALKKADAGIAVSGATDAARSAAAIVLTEPGLSVITDAIVQSRRVFARMNSYAVYRITETIRVLFFITLSILVINFYPVTALMIVLLALLNDAPIMAIAYDRADYSRAPVRWDMRTVLSLSTFLGLVGVVSSFGLFYLARNVLNLPTPRIQSLLFLKLAVAGHLTIFLTRTRGPFWSSRPGGALFFSALATKALATLVVVYGWFMTPIGWTLAGLVWGYALVTFLITDWLKVRFYHLLDHGGIRFRSETSVRKGQPIRA